MQLLQFAVLGALAAKVAAVPFPASHVLHERRDHAPKAWIKRDRVDGSASLPVRIGMTQSNLDKGHDLLMEV
jgi:tripeptidyl-peptidase-1